MGLYSRQKTLKLNTNQSITVVGCGGIGFWVCKFAAMAGIEKIYAFDDDTLDESNLNRLDIPRKFINRNKADVTRLIIKNLREDCLIYAMPYKFNDHHKTGTDWLIDCTDNTKAQIENQRIADEQGMKYFKAGYDGEDFSINDRVAEFSVDDNDEGGYRTVPSWVCPAVIIASMAIAKIMKYPEKELHSNITGVFNSERTLRRENYV